MAHGENPVLETMTDMIIGSPRTVAAVGKIAESLNLAIQLGTEDTK